MDHRALGGKGLTVGAQGLGCMGMSVFATTDDIAAIEAIAPHGVDTGDRYAPALMGTLNG